MVYFNESSVHYSLPKSVKSTRFTRWSNPIQFPIVARSLDSSGSHKMELDLAEQSAKIAAIVSQSALCLTGFSINFLLMYAIMCHTPASFKNYSSLLLLTAINDTICIVCDALNIIRTLPTPFVIGHIWHGLCLYVSKETCHNIFSVYLHTITNAIALMVVSFWYRYYVLRHSHPPRPLKVAILFIVLYLPSFAQMVTLPFARLPSDAVRASLSPFYQNLEKYDFTGTPSMGNLFADYGTWYPMIMPIPCYAFILIVRYKIVRQLRASGSQISERTKELHIQLVRTLTYHACLPFFVVIADAMFTVLLMDVYRHPLMENFVFCYASLPACLSPIFTMLLIRPYRAFLFRKSRSRRRVDMADSAMTISNTIRMPENSTL